MRPESLQFLREIVNIPSPPGREQKAAEAWKRYVRTYANEIRTDLHGNTFAIVNPHAELRIMLAGHLDEIAFIVHFISEDGLLYFKGVGGHDPVVPVGQRVWVHGKDRQIPGVIGRKPIHLLSDDDELGKKAPQMHEMWIDIGVSSRKEAEALAPLGTAVTYVDEFQTLEGDRAVARGFDDKVGAFVVAEAVRLLVEQGGPQPGVGVWAVATVQEEIGFRGATTAAYAARATTGLAVDVGHATDYPGISKERHGQVDIGKGPTITRGAFTSWIVDDMLEEIAQSDGIPYQVEVAADCTGTDATPMQIAHGGMAVSILSVPLRYMHTPCELLSLTDAENCARLLAAYCRRVSPDTDFTPRA
jgi:putative aminopeptidase FrvX